MDKSTTTKIDKYANVQKKTADPTNETGRDGSVVLFAVCVI